MPQQSHSTFYVKLLGPSKDVKKFLQILQEKGIILSDDFVRNIQNEARQNQDLIITLSFPGITGDQMLAWIDFFRWNDPEHQDTNFLWGTGFFLQAISCIGDIVFELSSQDLLEHCWGME